MLGIYLVEVFKRIPQTKNLYKNVHIKSPHGKIIKSKKLQTNILTKDMGVTSQVNVGQSS